METDRSPSPPPKRVKICQEEEEVENGGVISEDVSSQKNNEILQSPITIPMLVPEMWAKIFEYLPNSDLQTVMNTCPEWNKILTLRKPKILLERVFACMRRRLSWNDALVCRLVSKSAKTGVDSAYPEISEMYTRLRLVMQPLLEAFQAGVRREIRWIARQQRRREQGLPEELRREVGDDEEEEPGQENEFNDDHVREYLRARFPQVQQQQQQQ